MVAVAGMYVKAVNQSYRSKYVVLDYWGRVFRYIFGVLNAFLLLPPQSYMWPLKLMEVFVIGI